MEKRGAITKPEALQRGQTIGVIAPAGAIRDGTDLAAGVNALRQAGFEVELSLRIEDRMGYLAGAKEIRARDLEEFFLREDIRAIFCARGGFGSIQLLPLLDSRMIRSHPKAFVGYSDITILLNWLVQRCGFVSFHGPMVSMEFARGLKGRTADFFWNTLLGATRQWQVRGHESVRPGKAEAPMIGGCLSVIVTTIGTPYEVDTSGKILFLEDTGEQPYRIERMLTHLQMAGKLNGVAGVVFGHFAGSGGDTERGIIQVVHDLFRNAPYPVIAGFPAGHGEENLLLPFGTRMALDGDGGILSMVESPVT